MPWRPVRIARRRYRNIGAALSGARAAGFLAPPHVPRAASVGGASSESPTPICLIGDSWNSPLRGGLSPGWRVDAGPRLATCRGFRESFVPHPNPPWRPPRRGGRPRRPARCQWSGTIVRPSGPALVLPTGAPSHPTPGPRAGPGSHGIADRCLPSWQSSGNRAAATRRRRTGGPGCAGSPMI